MGSTQAFHPKESSLGSLAWMEKGAWSKPRECELVECSLLEPGCLDSVVGQYGDLGASTLVVGIFFASRSPVSVGRVSSGGSPKTSNRFQIWPRSRVRLAAHLRSRCTPHSLSLRSGHPSQSFSEGRSKL